MTILGCVLGAAAQKMSTGASRFLLPFIHKRTAPLVLTLPTKYGNPDGGCAPTSTDPMASECRLVFAPGGGSAGQSGNGIQADSTTLGLNSGPTGAAASSNTEGGGGGGLRGGKSPA